MSPVQRVTTWQALTGKNPFAATSANESLTKIYHGAKPPLSKVDPPLAGALESALMGIELSELVETTSVEVSDLPGSVQEQLVGGIRVNSESQASETVKAYRQQITDEKTKAAETADEVRNGDASASEATGSTSPDSPTNSATPSPETSATEGGA